jgi:TolB protein
MRLILTLMVLFFIYNSFGQFPQGYDYCYENSKGICVYSIAEKNELVIPITGTWANLSPDGTKITYTGNTKNGERNICIYDLTTKQNKVMNINSQYCFGSVWSPDGHFIAYNVLYKREMNNMWGIAVIDTANHQPIDIAKAKNFFSVSWTADSKRILTHDMDTVFVFNLEGKIETKYKIKEFGGSSGDNCIMTPDEKNIVFNAVVDEPDLWDLNDWPSAIFVYDITSKTTKRITPAGYCCLGPYLVGDRIFFDCFPPKSTIRDIYSCDLEGNNLKLELNNCSSFSARRK